MRERGLRKDWIEGGKAYAAMVGVNSKGCPTNKLVLGGQPNNSYLMMKINGAGVCFVGGRMPPGGALPAAQASTISAWITGWRPQQLRAVAK